MDHHRGLKIFLIIWAGQAASMLGTSITRFALLIWAFELTGKATTLALLGFFSFAVYVSVGLVAGVWVDRWNRKIVMIAADLGAGLITLSFLLLNMAGELQIWHLYLGEALTGLFSAFQEPAYNASMSILVPRQHLARMNGLRSLSWDTTNVLAPVLGGLLLKLSGLNSVLLVDLGTLVVAVGTLVMIRIPRPVESSEGRAARKSGGWQELTFGTRYIMRHHGLLGLVIIFMLIHLFAALTYFSILPAMILTRSGGEEWVLSSVQSVLGIGGIVGGIVLTIWGGPRRKIHGVLGFCAASFLLGDLLFAVSRTPAAWMLAAFATTFFIPFIGSANRAIWQSKVPFDVQGRVLGASYALQQITRPVGYLLAGPLADQVFGPAMMTGGALSGTFGWLVGTGPGAGMGLMFVFTGLFGTLSCLSGYLIPALRNVERDLPDYDAVRDSVLSVEAVVGD